MKSSRATLALAAFLLAPGLAQAQEKRPLTALDLYHLKTAGGLTLSPDGRRAVYVVTQADSATNRYRRDLWLAETDGSAPPRRLTWNGSTGTAVFSPDGRSLAFSASRQGGRPQIWILPLADGGEAWPLTELETGAGGPVWSPDGRRIAFTSQLTPEQIAKADSAAADSAKKDEPKVDAAAIRNIDDNRAAALAAIRAKLARNAREQDPRVVTRLDYLGETEIQDESYGHVYVVDVRQGAKPLRLTSGVFFNGDPAWHPRGDSIIYAASPPGGDYHPDYELEGDLFVVAASGGGRPRRITEPGFAEGSPAWTPDGRWIVYNRQNVKPPYFTASNSELVVMRPDGGGRTSVTGPLDRSVGEYELTPDGWLYFTVQSEGAVPLYRTRVDAVRPEPVVRGPRGVLSFEAAGGRLAWSQMDPRRPSDVYTAAFDGSSERRLTTLNDSLLAAVHVGEYHEIWYPSYDGRRIQGWYVLPVGYKPGSRPPLAVEIHGGPHAMWGPGEASMWLEYQTLAGAGYTVFFSNPRGSGGYGEEGLRSIHRGWGTKDAQDILIGADSVIARGLARRDQQAVTGGSYAGFMTTWLISQAAPERFRAAVSQRGVYDLGIWYGGSNTWRLFEGEFETLPWRDPEIVRQHSPLSHVENIRTPLLILHGDVDYRTTIAGAEALYRAMKVLRKEVEFVRYPREGHELTRSGEPAHRIDHMYRILEFFERHIRH